MSAPQKIVEVAVAKAAAEDAARRKAAGAVPHTHRSRDLLIAFGVVAALVLTLTLAIYAGR